jgi:hypothetical protein
MNGGENMAENFEKGFKQIAELLSQDGVVDSLKGILGGLGGSSSEKASDQAANKSDEKGEAKTTERTEKTEKAVANASSDDMRGDDMRFVVNIARAMSEYKNASDPSANLLSAIKPFLNEKRQKACVNCVKVLKMAKVYEYMKKNGENFAL